MISTLEASIGKNPEDDERIREEIKTLTLHKEYVMKNPDSLGMFSEKTDRFLVKKPVFRP